MVSKVLPTEDWSLAGPWNASLLNMPTKPVEKRDHLWASELGKSPVDVFYHVNGTTPTNPPNARSRRKFEAGNVFEWIVRLMLQRAGILQDEQVHCKYQHQSFLEVTGKCDFIAGGTPDFKKAMAELAALDMPEVFMQAAKEMDVYFQKNYPAGVRSLPVEVKSVSAFMFEGLLQKKTAIHGHRLQMTHYLKALKYDKGHILYICRDDLRMMEVPILNGGRFEQEYFEAIEKHSYYIQKNEVPPLEEPIVYDEDTMRFTTNWRIGYSLYLSMLYGFKDQAEFDEKYKAIPPKWNSTLNRFRAGKKMTKLNLERMKEISDAGFDLPKIAMSSP